MTKISVVGDIMLGRFVADKYNKERYSIFSDEVLSLLKESDLRIANLESPIVKLESKESLKFAGSPELLEQVKWVDCFSISNNHINDFGEIGMKQTIENLDNAGIVHNGLYKTEYVPYIVNHQENKIAVITCADMMNYEFSNDCEYKTLRMNKPDQIFKIIKQYKQNGYLVILFLHAGMLFSRYLNPVVRDFAHSAVDAGADAIVTAHSHCLGGYEKYKGSWIFNSLGDFLMDGSSYRRRTSCILQLEIENNQIVNFAITPTITTSNLQTTTPDEKEKMKLLKSISQIEENIQKNSKNYIGFFKKQYKKEMLLHSVSTIKFEYQRRGFSGLIRILCVRISDILGMAKRILTDRSKMSYDSDAVHSSSNDDIR